MNRIKAFCIKHYYLLTSILMFFSFPSYDVWFLKAFPFFAWIALAPVFNYVRDKKPREVYLFAFLAGLLGNFLAYEWIGQFGKTAGGYVVIIAFLMPSLSVFFALKIFAAEMLSRRFEKLRVLIFPSVWIVLDWVQTIGFLAYPLPNWAYSQYPFTPFIQMASFTGIMGVTFVIVLANYLAADLIRARGFSLASVRELLRLKEARRLVAVIGFVALITLYGAVIMTLNGQTAGRDLRVAMVQTCISPWENWSENRFAYLAELKRYTGMAMGDRPDLVIWSESATLETISYDYEQGLLNEFDREVLDLARRNERPLLTGEIGVVEDYSDIILRRYPRNNAVLISGEGEVEGSYSKIHLVPFGEWFPYEKWLGFVKRITESMGASSFVPGDRPKVFETGGRKFGVLICYEGIFQRLCRKYRAMGAEYFVNITNDGWTDTFRGHMQHFSASKFRAVENGIWYLRAGNTGYTAFIDPYGRIRKSIPILKKGFLVSEIDFSLNHRTLYSLIGDAFLYLVMAFCIAIVGVMVFEKALSLTRKKS
jgi:apolipoprotein N-acyltransferase